MLKIISKIHLKMYWQTGQKNRFPYFKYFEKQVKSNYKTFYRGIYLELAKNKIFSEKITIAIVIPKNKIQVSFLFI